MDIKIRKFKREDAEKAAKLIRETFLEFLKGEAYDGGEWYFSFYNKPKRELLAIFNKSSIFFVAVDGKRIIGLIRGNKGRITNLYLNKKYHNKGIGKELVDKFEGECKKQKSKLIKVKASLYATPVYQKLGYKKTTGVRNHKKSRMKIQPMQKVLK